MVIPTIYEGSRGWDIFSKNLEKGIITLSGEINDEKADIIMSAMHYLNSKEMKEICLYINSPGGSVTAGLAIYDTMQYVKSDIVTVCVGLAASMGAILLSGGTRGKRMILPNAEVMIHQPLGGMQGQAKELEIAANHILKTKEKLYHLLAVNCSKEISQIREDAERDFWMNSEEAVKYGIADIIL